jgi:hypothetical protein
MNAKEKAKELVDRFTVVGLQQRDEGIECALICVDECKKVAVHIDERFGSTFEFWEEVEKELKK